MAGRVIQPSDGTIKSSVKSLGPVGTLGDYINLSGQLIRESGLRQSTSSLWWRGQADNSWKLLPSLYRSQINSDKEREIARDFKLKSPPFIVNHRPMKNIEWLFLMQHHGTPTRILDWSESPLVALYFSVENFEYKNDGAVWILDPWVLNLITDGQQSIPTTDSPKISDYIIDFDDPNVPRAPNAEFPLAIRIEYGFNRAHTQRGAATIHGHSKRSLEELKNKISESQISKTKQQKLMCKIVIDGKKKFDILKELYEYGIGADTLFPDLSGLSAAISFRYNHRYLDEKMPK